MEEEIILEEATDTFESGNKIKGLSEKECNDPNKIKVEIANEKAPIIVLYGPPSCGKTMTLVRLTRYLKQNGYTISPVRSFRPSEDTHYKRMCDGFDEMIYSEEAASSTSLISFMLVEVIKDGKTICQILEAPGEYYYDPTNTKAEYPKYIHALFAKKNRKIWCIMVEPDWKDMKERSGYVDRIVDLKPRLNVKDKVVFILNKIDKSHFVASPGRVNLKAAIKYVMDNYKGLFTPFRNMNPITRFWKEYNSYFVPFQTGGYSKALDGTLSFEEGSDVYPQMLWNLLLKRIRG